MHISNVENTVSMFQYSEYISETYRSVCFANNPIKLNLNQAIAFCESFGTSMANCLNEEEKARLSIQL